MSGKAATSRVDDGGRQKFRSKLSQPIWRPTRLQTAGLSCLALLNMSLVEASEARKARLIALRKRKAGEAVDDNGYVFSCPHSRLQCR